MHLAPAMRPEAVAEWPGLDGMVTVSEGLIQGIWRRGEFVQDGLRLGDGTPFSVRSPGRWNLLGGPDFLDARLEFPAGPRLGDVEVHFRAGDWFRHGHHEDPAYDRVLLHVLLLPRGPGEPMARTRSGDVPGEVVLLPRLLHDLEGYLRDDEVRRAAGRRDGVEAPPGANEAPALLARLRELGDSRWRQKAAWAAARVAAVGRDAACHQRLLECIGGPAMRALGAALAWRHPWDGETPPRVEPEAWLATPGLPEVRGPCRPANRPEVRLLQLRAILERAPDWPRRLETWASTLAEAAGPPDDVPGWRRLHGFGDRRREVADVLGGAIGGPKLDGLVVDVLLPLGAALTGRELGAWWWTWPPGNRPASWRESAKLLGVALPGAVWSHGWLTAAGEYAAVPAR